jgi:hydrogenase nickel incorporation protein HypA/HybF
MHEMAIADELIRTAQRELARIGIGERVLELKLTMSRFSCVNPDSLRFAFALLSSESALKGAVLEFETEPLTLFCHQCGASIKCDDFLEKCPRCGADEVHFEGERAVRLESIEIEE